jgi:hypothetical protein
MDLSVLRLIQAIPAIFNLFSNICFAFALWLGNKQESKHSPPKKW